MSMSAGKTRHRAEQWSAKVTRESNALDLEEGVFTWKNSKRIAKSLKRSAETSTRRRASPFKSTMSMLVFYVNRAGSNLDERQLHVLELAKQELRNLYGQADKMNKARSGKK
jgi:putative cell wall-binding protein